MKKRSFAHTENPTGSAGPVHQTKALNALSELAKRGQSNIKGDQVRQPMAQKKAMPKPPSPVALEAISRSMPQTEQQPMPQPQEFISEQFPIEEMRQQPLPPMEYQPPPYDGYYGQLVAQEIMKNPMPEGQPDPRIEILTRFATVRAKLDSLKNHLDSISGNSDSIRENVRRMNMNSANV